MTRTAAASDPFDLYAQLGARSAVASLGRSSLALDHRSCARVLADHSSFSSAPVQDADAAAFPPLSMLTADPPAHARLRSATSHALRQSQVTALRPRFALFARSLVRELGDGPDMELISGLAAPVAEAAVAEILAIPECDRHRLPRWCAAVMAAARRGVRPFPTEDDEAGVRELKDCLRDALRRTTVPAGPLLDALRTDHREKRLSTDEAVASALAVIVGGVGTTTHLIGSTLVALLDPPHRYVQVVADRRLLHQALAETLRHSPPVLAVPRWARHDLLLEGQPIESGASVLAVIGAANRDPHVWTEGSRFDLRRRRGRSLSFGSGPHHCPGSGFALEVARVALDAVMDRYPVLTPAQGRWVARVPSFFVYGPARLHAYGGGN